jgi:Superinfection immunity protein
MNTLIGLTVVTMLIGVGIVAYLLPTLVAVLRHTPDLAAVIVINILLGWCVLGWVLAMVLAVRRAAPSIQVIGQVNGNAPIRRLAAHYLRVGPRSTGAHSARNVRHET